MPARHSRRCPVRAIRAVALHVASVVAVALAPMHHARAQPVAPAPRAESPAEPPDTPPERATMLRLHLAEDPDAAYRRVTAVLSAFAYVVEDAGPRALTTRPRHVGGAGMVQLSAEVLPDGAGAVVQLSGVSRTLQHVLVVSAMGRPAPIAFGVGGRQQRRAWDVLAEVGAALSPRRVTYRTGA